MTERTLTTILRAPRRGYAAAVQVWTRRARSRRALHRLDAHLLRDIGLSDHEARREADRPFWD